LLVPAAGAPRRVVTLEPQPQPQPRAQEVA
jgi:hypothetical protein